MWLEDVESPNDNRRELLDYARGSLQRFRLTMALLPALPRGAPVLEVGANPYFLTRLLQRRGIEPTCTNWFGPGAYSVRGSQTFTTPRTGARVTFDFDHFNAESDLFPYPTSRFGAVLCCGILELLPSDPTHLLAEVHRVLEPGGLLVLTTPNAVRWETMARIEAGWPIGTKLSNHGLYGRANREYTIGEVSDLLGELGYHLEEAFTADALSRPTLPRLPPGANPLSRGDTIFIRARAEGRARWRYPSWLYNGPAHWKVVQPDVVMGFNDDVQARGLYPLETVAGGPMRWMGNASETVLLVEAPGGDTRLVVSGIAPPPGSCRRIKLSAVVGGQSFSWMIDPDQSRFHLSSPVPLPAGVTEVRLSTDRTWRPSEIGLGSDERSLSIGLCRVAVESEAPVA